MLTLDVLVREALKEDIGQGDATTNTTVPRDARCRAHLLAKQNGVLSGIEVFRMVFDNLDTQISNWQSLNDGDHFKVGDELASFEGRTGAVLRGERVALNFIQRLSGIATMAAAFVKAVNGLPTRICDTRKTTPLLRALEKQAVQHGGATNHRYALFDGVLIKENHVTAAGGIRPAIKKAREGTHHLMKIGVEVTTLEELNEAVEAEAEVVLLDNMSVELMREAVRRVADTDVLLEASGNVNLNNVRAIAETGVHFVSVGGLTHSAPAVDLSITIENV